MHVEHLIEEQADLMTSADSQSELNGNKTLRALFTYANANAAVQKKPGVSTVLSEKWR